MPVEQSGTITAGHAAFWVAPGIVGDGGTSATGALNTLGLQSSSISSFGINNAAPAGAHNRLTFGVSGATAEIGINAFNGAAQLPLRFNLHGTYFDLVDSTTLQATSASIKIPAALASTANLTLSGEQTIDGTLTSSTRLLVKDQTAASQNGIYDTGGSAWTRATDLSSDSDIVQGTLVSVTSGTINGDTMWRISSANPIVVGTDDIDFEAAQFVAAMGAFTWKFDTSTSMTDPGSGDVRFNNATVASVTALAISANTADIGQPDISAYVATWGDSTSTIKGTITLIDAANGANFAIFDITAAVVDNTTWLQITVTHSASGGTISSAARLVTQFVPTGDEGSLGATLSQSLDTNSFSIDFSQGANIASVAGDTDIWANSDGNTVHITGTEIITDFGTPPRAGAFMWVIFDGAASVVDSATITVAGNTNFQAAANDMGFVYALTTSTFLFQPLPNDWQPTGTADTPTFVGINLGDQNFNVYKVANWTPVLTFVTPGDLSVAYATQIGRSVTFGDVVLAWFVIRTSTFTHTSASGDMRITGLPSAASADGGIAFYGGGMRASGVTKANFTDFAPVVEENTSIVSVNASGSAQSSVFLASGDMPTGGTVLLEGLAVYTTGLT